MTWKIETPALLNTFLATIPASELTYVENKEFIDRVNDTIDNYDNQKQDYPTGNTLTDQGEYIKWS